jgi:hypothetical protein
MFGSLVIAACGSSGKPSATASASTGYSQAVKYSNCMRSHGVPNFPDPTNSPPPSNPSGDSLVMSRNGATVALPSSIDVNSPVFKQAAAACNFGSRAGSAGVVALSSKGAASKGG